MTATPLLFRRLPGFALLDTSCHHTIGGSSYHLWLLQLQKEAVLEFCLWQGSGLSWSGWDRGTSPRAEGSCESTLGGLYGPIRIGSPLTLAAPSSASMKRLLGAGGLLGGQKSNQVTREPLWGPARPPAPI